MRRLSFIAILLLGLGTMHGCSCSDNGSGADGGDDSGVGGDMAVDTSDLSGTVNPSTDGGCTATGQSCAMSAECCSGVCNGTSCVAGMCGTTGATCKTAADCCNLICNMNGTCGSGQCVSDNQPCTAGGTPCCSTTCGANGMCTPLNPMCKTAGNTCGGNAECCSQVCTGGACVAPSQISYCTQPGDICFHDNDCCTGVCTKASGATAGTCANLNTGCAIDGLVCNGCTGCCSSFCAPFGPGASHICQPASGCHVTGDLCHVNSDCCGGDPTVIGNIPGAGLIKCVPVAGFPQIGTCSTPNPNNCPTGQSCGNSCVPEGDVCHFKGNGGCSSNAIRNDCCAAPGNSGVCKLDSLGIPRCYGIGMCVMPGGACASSADCCNNLPCVPDMTGHLHCGAMCSQLNQVCTTTADCCTGLQCVVPPGTLQGTCQNPNFPPPPPDGGFPDLAGADLAGQPPPDLSQPPPPMCALFGQSCSTTTPCCTNNGTCLSPFAAGSNPCAAGEMDCTCYNKIL
jgi:hypothetical protein